MSRPRLAALLLLLAAVPAAHAQRQFGFDNRKPSGQPYLSAEESVKRFTVPDGYSVEVFAAEPDVINPVAFTVDERGRLWVVECFEYPKRTPPGQKPRDRIKILEDTDGDGRCDKVTVFAEGKDFPVPPGRSTAFDLATGIEVGHGGVFLGAAPYLWFLRDTDGDDKCDRYDILLSGFGSQDTHETLNTFTWGPEGRLYGLHGVFTHSEVGGVKMNAAVWRYDVRTRRFEVFAEGTSNPWGLDFDARGNCFLCCCVIPHLFHIVPGGTYKRQAGASFNPYAYGLLNEICDHTHHQESGWAHAGLLVLEGDHVPPELRGSVVMGSIHGCCLKRNRLERNGSTFVGRRAPDFLTSGDKNLRPINLRWGPDDSIYLIDWHDQNPCHQAPPDSWDKERGRVYKIVRTGAKAGRREDLAKRSTGDLVELLKRSNPWWHRTALRLLAERRDRAAIPLLRGMAESADETTSLRGLWALAAAGALNEETAVKAVDHAAPAVRAWAVRLLGEMEGAATAFRRLRPRLAAEAAPEVRLQIASTAQRLAGTPDALALLNDLLTRREDANDACLPLMVWLAYEPHVVPRRDEVLARMRQHAPHNALVRDEILPRVLRRLVAAGGKDELAACVAHVAGCKDATERRRALEGMALAAQGRLFDVPPGWALLSARLNEDPDPEVRRLARSLGVRFRDLGALRRALEIARDTSRGADERCAAVRDLAAVPLPEARQPLLELLARDKDAELRAEACRALVGYDGSHVARAVLAGWKTYPPPLRAEAVNLLTGRREWAAELLAAVADGRVPRAELTDNSVLRMRALRDARLDALIRTTWGQVRDTPAGLAALIDRMRKELDAGPGSFERGRKVFDNHCAKCHRFEGRGHDVGPALDGAARDVEYLLANVLDPNRVVGRPYFLYLVALKNGRVESGLLAAEDGTSLTLKAENGATKVIPRKEVEELTVQEKSIMPEGLAGAMTPQDFRDLVRYLMANPYLTAVEVAGPFPDPAAAPPADATWSRPTVGVTGRIPLPPGDQGVAFVRAAVTAPSALKVRLVAEAGQPIAVWLNGAPAGTVSPEGGIDLQLRRGRNELVLRATSRDASEGLRVRLLDPERRLAYPEGER